MISGFKFKPSAFHLALCALPLAFLWYRLIDHLRVEWTVNPQYGYGWAVPCLCLFLIWRRIHPPHHPAPTPNSQLPSSISYFLFALCALLYAPTRLIQEANPEWRLVSWALALEVVGITLLFLRLALGTSCFQVSSFRFQVSTFVFPLFFFLVAVPWPTVVEGPVIQHLTQANTAATVELLGMMGVPALQHGNVIEIAAGMVGIDDACSGIRSFQATLMISLFLGELYSLGNGRRALFVLAGFALSFLFNVGRTTLLVWVAARDGIAAIAKWHDPAGVTILVGCFCGLWAIGLWLKHGAVERAVPCTPTDSTLPQLPSPNCHLLISTAVALIAWLVLVESGVETWYRVMDRRETAGTEWKIEPPTSNPMFAEADITQEAAKLLRYDFGKQWSWMDSNNVAWQMFFFEWKSGRTSGYLAKRHTPEVCLPAMGYRCINQTPLKMMQIGKLVLPYRFYTFSSPNNYNLFVIHSRWERGVPPDRYVTESPNAENLLRSVWNGRGQQGQKVIELAGRGFKNAEQAETTMKLELAKLVVER